jgi:hypothetical protein
MGTFVGQPQLGIAGNYRLRVRIGKQDVTVSPESFTAIDIIEYIDRILPAFTVTFKDARGILTHKTLTDSMHNTMTFSFAMDNETPYEGKDMRFRIYRRKPEMYTEIANMVKFTGLLDVPNVFSPQYQKGWVKTSIQSILEDIGASMGIASYRFDPGLTQVVSIVQPQWNNAMFLQYLADRVAQSFGETGYFAFVDVDTKGDPRLNFRSLTSLLKQQAKKVIKMTKMPDGIMMPLYNFEGIDNFEPLNILGIGKQSYSYFNWMTGVQVDDEIPIEEAIFTSLSKYFAHDPTINTVGITQQELGRTNEMVPDWKPVLKGRYYKKINSLVKQWITTMGTTELSCGDLIKVVFTEDPAEMMNYQYTGFWMIERIVHHISNTYLTKLLVTRPGVDSEVDTTLQRAPMAKIL